MEYTLEASILSNKHVQKFEKVCENWIWHMPNDHAERYDSEYDRPVKIQETSMSFAFSYCCLIHRKANDEVVIACVLWVMRFIETTELRCCCAAFVVKAIRLLLSLINLIWMNISLILARWRFIRVFAMAQFWYIGIHLIFQEISVELLWIEWFSDEKSKRVVFNLKSRNGSLIRFLNERLVSRKLNHQ